MQHTVQWADVMLHSLLLFHKEIVCFLVYKITTSCSEFKSRICSRRKKRTKKKKKITLFTVSIHLEQRHNIANTAFESLSRDRIALPFFLIRLLRSRKTAWIKQDLCWACAACMLLIRRSFEHRSNNCELATVTNQWRDACTQKNSLRRENKIA